MGPTRPNMVVWWRARGGYRILLVGSLEQGVPAYDHVKATMLILAKDTPEEMAAAKVSAKTIAKAWSLPNLEILELMDDVRVGGWL